MTLAIQECQTHGDGTHCWDTNGTSRLSGGYKFVRRQEGLYVFSTGDTLELFARRKSVAGWHLRRGAWSYEFVRCVR